MKRGRNHNGFLLLGYVPFLCGGHLRRSQYARIRCRSSTPLSLGLLFPFPLFLSHGCCKSFVISLLPLLLRTRIATALFSTDPRKFTSSNCRTRTSTLPLSGAPSLTTKALEHVVLVAGHDHRVNSLQEGPPLLRFLYRLLQCRTG